MAACEVARSLYRIPAVAELHQFILCTRRSGGTVNEGGGATSQLYLPSLTPLSVAGCGRLQLGVNHWATAVDYCKQLIIDPTFCGSRFSTGRLLGPWPQTALVCTCPLQQSCASCVNTWRQRPVKSILVYWHEDLLLILVNSKACVGVRASLCDWPSWCGFSSFHYGCLIFIFVEW